MTAFTRRVAISAALTVVAAMTFFVSPAHAVVLNCGDAVAVNTTLTADVGPCPGEGLVVVASNLTLNLNGHKVFGQASPGQGAGITVFNGLTNVTITSGEVTAFDAGVALLGGTAHRVQSMHLHDNIGPVNGDFGDGVTMQGTDNSFVTGNLVEANGPYDGIGMFGNTDGNQITGNVVRNNVSLGSNHGAGTAMQNTGIRLENGSDGNLVQSNSVTGNGLDGIEIFANSDNNTVRFNNVTGNGFNNNPAGGLRVGDGINAFSGASGNVIQSNVSSGNAGSGVKMYTNAMPNTMTTNVTLGNNAQPNAVSTGYDRTDLNLVPPCGTNAWHSNIGVTFNQICVTFP